MIKLTQPETKTLKWSLIMGLPLFLFFAIPYWLYTKTGQASPEILRYSNYLPVFFILSVETIVNKKWKHWLIYMGAMAIYQVINYYVNFQNFNSPYRDELGSIMIFLSGWWLFLLLRNYLQKKGIWFWSILGGALIINGIHGSQFSILYQLSKLIDTAGRYNFAIPLAYLFSPFVFWLLVISFDRLARPKEQRGSLYDVDKPINGSDYLRKVRMLNLMQGLILILFVIIWREFKDVGGAVYIYAFELVALFVGFLFLHGLVYVLSLRRIVATGVKEATIHRFIIPFINLMPAHALSTKEESDKYALKLEMERKLTFCRSCKNRSSTLKDGMVCGLTTQKPDFEGQCDDFDYFVQITKPQRRKAPKVLTNGIGIFLSVGILYTAFLIVTRFFVGRGPELMEIIITITSLIGYWVFFYFIYQQKQWAVFVLMGLMFLDLVYKGYSFRGDVGEYYLIWHYIVFNFILLVGFMPTWRYNGQKQATVEELLKV